MLTSTERRSALSFAASRDDKAMLKLLLKYGADVNFRGYRGRSTIWHVTDKEAAEILLDAGADVSDLGKLLKQVLSSGLRELAEFFLDMGAEPNDKNDLGWTPLMAAAYRPGEWPPLGEGEECVNILLDRGAKPELTDKWGQTALDYTEKGIHLKEVADILRPPPPTTNDSTAKHSEAQGR